MESGWSKGSCLLLLSLLLLIVNERTENLRHRRNLCGRANEFPLEKGGEICHKSTEIVCIYVYRISRHIGWYKYDMSSKGRGYVKREMERVDR